MTTNYKCEHCEKTTEIEVDFGVPSHMARNEAAKLPSINPEFCDHEGCGRAFDENKVFEQAAEEMDSRRQERAEQGE